MPRRLAQQRMTSNDLEWPFHASRAISAEAKLLVRNGVGVVAIGSHAVDYNVGQYLRLPVVLLTTGVAMRQENSTQGQLPPSCRRAHDPNS